MTRSLDDIHRALGVLDGKMDSVALDVRVTREASVEQGKAIAGLQATCAAREGRCGARFEGIGKRLSHISEEMGGVVETSQVLDAQRAAWRRVAASAWVVTRIVLLAAGALGIGGSIVAALAGAFK